jgi:hypothetical protein
VVPYLSAGVNAVQMLITFPRKIKSGVFPVPDYLNRSVVNLLCHMLQTGTGLPVVIIIFHSFLYVTFFRGYRTYCSQDIFSIVISVMSRNFWFCLWDGHEREIGTIFYRVALFPFLNYVAES